MAEEQKVNRRRELELKLPGGIILTIRGYDIVIILIVAAVAVFGYAIADTKSAAATAVTVAAEAVKQAHEEHQTLQRAIGVTNWILLQTPEKRAELAKKLDMPEELRKQLRNPRDD